MPGLAAATANQDVITYNGVTFPIAKSYKWSITSVYDLTGRIVKYRQVTLDVVAIFTPTDIGGNASDTFDTGSNSNFIANLSTPAKTLSITACGVGTQSFNPSNVLNRGPSPRVISTEPVGANNAIRVHWSVDFMVRNCTIGTFGEFSYSSSYNYDSSGMLTRTISGQAEAYVSFDTFGNKTGNNAESLRDTISIPLIPGFIRTQSWNVSPDQRILTFQITDTEIPSDNPYFPGMITMDIRQNTSGGMSTKSIRWNLGFSGTITIAPGVPRGLAFQAFLNVIQSRKQFFNQGSQGGPSNPQSQIIGIPNVTLDEQIFGRQFSFSVTYVIACSLSTILKASGMFQPIPGDWNTWQQSIAYTQAPRGVSGLATQDQNVILSFCDTGTPVIGYTNFRKDLAQSSQQGYNESCPPKEFSYLSYTPAFEFGSETQALVMSPVSPSISVVEIFATISGIIANPLATLGTNLTQGTSSSSSSGSTNPQVLQTSGQAKRTLRFYGNALRIGYLPEVPTVINVGGSPAEIKEQYISSPVVIGYNGNCPIYGIYWNITYYIHTTSTSSTDIQFSDNIPNNFKVQPAN